MNIKHALILIFSLSLIACAQASAAAARKYTTEPFYFSGLNVASGKPYTIWGNGFKANDKIKLTPTEKNNAGEIILNGEVARDRLKIIIPEGFQSGRYQVELIRNNKTRHLGFTQLNKVDALPATPKVTAHRGYWNTAGSAQNSITALRKAQELGVFASEFDVWLTADGKLVIHHDAKTINGISIQNSTYDEVKGFVLENGEPIPTLEAFLEQAKAKPEMTLAVEIKTHKTKEKNNAVVAATVKAINKAGLMNQVMFLAFNLDICKELTRIQPGCKVAYLNGDKPPRELHELGITGANYGFKAIRSNPHWIKEAHDLGMTINVRTLNTMANVIEMANLGVDYISSDCPAQAQQIVEHFQGK
ncbi:glycerophosphoryl diester phosphodiesterase [Ereboglobus sp. PH5-10]|uniref:glycerophosphodiester phosphodiesterase n=1 Tax=Ereboglobus sp. PH5-10 TaxID=2940629 RepID=UPI0024052759|nr:glycerophosphodiester phosphodiesterase family protein [Ereboglobus sp. PH5-10]MDF9826979.1 glycerophosphoryl diester phosphodiesterase [Ereboglobus sp. PH5-10]